MLRSCLLAGALGLAPWLDAPALAQPTNGTFLIMSSNPVSPAAPSTTVSVYAARDQPGPPGTPPSFVYSGALYDLVAAEGEFTEANLILGMSPPNNPGTPSGPRVNGAAIGQVVNSPIFLPLTDNPILLAEYTWTATSFARRSVELVTENTAIFAVVPWPGGVNINLVPLGEFTPGAGSISVVPAAPTVALLGAGACLAITRRRT